MFKDVMESKTRSLPDYCKHDMQFYDQVVVGTLRLSELEKWTIDRLLILGIILKIAAKNEMKTPNERREQLVAELREKGFLSFANLCDGKGCRVDTKERRRARKMDNVSHNILRLVFVNDETLDWFKRLESLFFRWRLEALDEEGIMAFKAVNNMKYHMLSEDEQERLKIHLLPLMEDPLSFCTTVFYEVPALEVLELVQRRVVYLINGTAYVTALQFRYLIYYHFQQRLSSQLEKSVGAMNYMGADERLEILGKRLRKIYEGLKPASWNPYNLNVDNLDELSETCYPPCMRKLHEALQKNQHLRNGGRLQYTLFLKAIGIPADQTLDYYKKIFTKKITPEAFDKNYAYQFRHMYGLVGAKKNYDNHECAHIAEESNFGPNDHHGCFFATGDIEDVGKKLDIWGIPSCQKREIVRLTGTKRYGKACSVYFDALHDSSMNREIFHPNDFFRESRKIRKTRIDDDPFYNDEDDDEYFDS